jgi:hypothetical protein
MGWTIGVRSPTGAEDFSSSLCVQTSSGAHPAPYLTGTGRPFPGGKAWPGRDADHSPPSSVEVKYEYELYLLSPHVSPWHVAGQLYFFTLLHQTAFTNVPYMYWKQLEKREMYHLPPNKCTTFRIILYLIQTMYCYHVPQLV